RHTRFSRDWSSDVCSSDLPCTRGVCSLPPLRKERSNLVGYLDLHAQHGSRECLPLRVRHQRYGTAAIECTMQQEVQRVQVGQLVTVNATVEHAREMLGYALDGQCLADDLPVLDAPCDDTDIDGVTLVAGAAVGEVVEQHTCHGHASSTSTRRFGSITLRSMSAGQYATISCTRG